MATARLWTLERHLAPTSAAAYSTTHDPLTEKTVGVVAKHIRASEGYTLFSSGCAVVACHTAVAGPLSSHGIVPCISRAMLGGAYMPWFIRSMHAATACTGIQS